MEMENVENLIREIGLLKERQAAVQELLDEKYALLEAALKSSGLTKYSVGSGKDGITARIKKSSRLELSNADGLLEAVSDPLQFARVVMSSLTITKKVMQALEQLGIPASQFFVKKEGKQYLEVAAGKEALREERIQEAKKEYYGEVALLQEELKDLVVEQSVKKFLREPVFPETTPVEKIMENFEEGR